MVVERSFLSILSTVVCTLCSTRELVLSRPPARSKILIKTQEAESFDYSVTNDEGGRGSIRDPRTNVSRFASRGSFEAGDVGSWSAIGGVSRISRVSSKSNPRRKKEFRDPLSTTASLLNCSADVSTTSK